jgi:prophage regulatory protein
MRKKKHAQESTATAQVAIEKPCLIGSKRIERRSGLSRWTVWRLEAEQRFPKSIRVGGKRLWLESEVDAWVAARLAERN